MSRARAGEITPQMAAVAKKESVEPEVIRDAVAAGRIVIPANINHKAINPIGIGRQLTTKINANIGNSTLSSCPTAGTAETPYSLKLRSRHGNGFEHRRKYNQHS